jgi:uncharacterized protein YciI
MKLKSFLITAVALSMAAVLYAQTSQSSQSNSNSQSGNGRSTSSASSSSSASGWSSSNGSRNSSAGGNHGGSGSGSGNGSGFGFNGKPTHAIMYTLDSSTSNDVNDRKVFEQHSKYMSDQQSKGKVLLFGPWRDQPGSMAIVMTKSDEEANEIAKNDPAVKSGNLTFEVRAWNVMTLAPASAPKIKL